MNMTIIQDQHNGVGIITLNRPEKRNAISIQMRKEIMQCLANWREADDIGVVIITGTGNVFSAGYDLEEFGQPELYNEIFRTSAKYHREVWNFPKPIIAAINGAAMGGAFDLATLCDIRICRNFAVFGHPEVKFGVPPLFTLLRGIIGDGRAREVCLTGRKINAEEALRMGLVTEIVDGDVLKMAIQLSCRIMEAPNDTLQYAKRFFIDTGGKGFEASFLIEHDKAFNEIIFEKMKNKDKVQKPTRN
jgi:enoyl-CoA hydratase/carnithine racemase